MTDVRWRIKDCVSVAAIGLLAACARSVTPIPVVDAGPHDSGFHGCRWVAPPSVTRCDYPEEARCAIWATELSRGSDLESFVQCTQHGCVSADRSDLGTGERGCGLGMTCNEGSACARLPGEEMAECVPCER